MAEASPVLEPFQIFPWLAEKLKLHLFEFTCTESKVTWRDFITEAFTDLADTKWQFFTHRTLYVFEVNENPLCCFRT